MSRFLRHALLSAAVIAAACVTLPMPQALAACSTVGTDQNCTNPAGTTVSGGSNGIFDFNNLTVTNFGTITGTGYGIFAGNKANVVNYGTITATDTGGVAGIYAFGTVNINNTGTISGPIGITTGGAGTGSVLTNSGTIIGLNGKAIDFSFSGADTLTFLPGTRIVGDIILGAGSSINIRTGRDIAWLLTFNACGCGFGLVNPGTIVNFTGGAPYVVNGNQIATLDPTAFGLTDKTLMDFTGFISSVLGSRFGEFAFTGTIAAGPSAFAPAANGIIDGANAAFDGVLAYAGDSRMPNAAAVDRASGIAVWSKGFAAARQQPSDGPNLSASTVAFGGVMGLDKQMTSNLRLGVFLGASNGRLKVDLDSQKIKTDYVFGGVYGRFDWAAQFLDFAVSTGGTANSSDRLVANNLVAGGLETAKASYNGWFVSPELAYGVRMPMAGNFVMTPTARLRYLAGFFNGYGETGSSQNLTVASRTVQNLEERFELAFSQTDLLRQGVLTSTATVGVLAQERLGTTSINTVLIGQNLAFATPGQNNVAGFYIGLGVDYRLTQTVSLFAATQGTLMTDNSVTGIAQAGVKVSF